jgi:hypothetical protein
MGDTPRWVIAVIVVLVIIGLIGFARGRAHHRGDEVGSRAAASSVLVTS